MGNKKSCLIFYFLIETGATSEGGEMIAKEFEWL